MNVENKKHTACAPYFIIGSGRLATHLAHYFNLLGLNPYLWNRKQTTEDLEEILKRKPTVILAISDGALEKFYIDHLQHHNLTVVHCSGALHSEKMISCHPLMTFGPDLYPLDTYQKIFFAVTGINQLQQIFPFFPNTSFVLQPQDKPLYHALCVLCAAGAQKIWNQSESLLSNLGVPPNALNPYIHQITENYLSTKSLALTGPWARGEEITIQKNLMALSDLKSQSLFKVYEILKAGTL